jgi:hypothetical protein
MDKEPKITMFEGIIAGNRFFSSYEPDKDQTKLDNGIVAYRILGYADSTEEAQLKLYGRTYPLDSKEPIVDVSQRIS